MSEQRYMLLNVGDKVQEGDEYYYSPTGTWCPVSGTAWLTYGGKVISGRPHRRPIPPQQSRCIKTDPPKESDWPFLYWHSLDECWYGSSSFESAMLLIEGATRTYWIPAPPAPPPPKADWERAFEKAYPKCDYESHYIEQAAFRAGWEARGKV